MSFRSVWILSISVVLILLVSLSGGAQGAALPAATPPPLRIFLPGVLNGPGGVSSPGSTSTPIPLPTSPAPTPIPTTPPTTQDPVLIGAGDIATCGVAWSAQTAALLAANPGTVMALGDGAYPNGTAAEYQTCYDPVWGPFKNQTVAVAGNHDYLTTGATGYFGYFGAAAGDPAKGYYSFNLGAWHLVVLNSNCVQVGGCNAGNPQETWLKADLAANPAKCTLAMWHHPLFTSGTTPGNFHLATLYQDLYDAGADVLVSAHDHNYERFAPQDAQGTLDSARGLVEFVAGTGGSNHTPLVFPLQPNSLVSNDADFGVLKLTLHPSSYTWQFLPISGVFTDSGTAQCH
jgi:acid phosphatase type 7